MAPPIHISGNNGDMDPTELRRGLLLQSHIPEQSRRGQQAPLRM